MTVEDNPKTFCILPWQHMATHTNGSVVLCCVARNDSKLNLNYVGPKDAWNSKYYRDVRLKMLAGEPVSACTRCYEEEKSGYRSHRVVENKVWQERLGSDLYQHALAATDEKGKVSNGIAALDLRLGYTCNLQCIMCQPQESSRWVGAAKKIANMVQDPSLKGEWDFKSKINVNLFEWYKRQEFWDQLEFMFEDMLEIIIAGGEPMLIEEHKEFIKRLSDSGHAGKIHLRYHTNGTVLPDELFPYWEKFGVTQFLISLDNLRDRNNYIRYPAKWNDIERVVHRIDQSGPNIQLMFLNSVQALNINDLPEYCDWVDSNNFLKTQGRTWNYYLQPSLVFYPQHLNIRILPEKLKKEITTKINSWQEKLPTRRDKIDAIVQHMNSEDHSHLLPRFKEYIESLDKMRGTNFSETFPELYERIW